jgi:hypothetical protein
VKAPPIFWSRVAAGILGVALLIFGLLRDSTAAVLFGAIFTVSSVLRVAWHLRQTRTEAPPTPPAPPSAQS